MADYIQIEEGIVTGRIDRSDQFDTASLIADLSEEAALVDATAIQQNAYNLADSYRAQANAQALQTFGQTFASIGGGLSNMMNAPAGSTPFVQAAYFFQGL